VITSYLTVEQIVQTYIRKLYQYMPFSQSVEITQRILHT